MTAATDAPRLKPLQAPYTAETAAQLARWMPPGADVEPLALFRTLNLHPELATRMLPLGSGILGRSATVQPRLREVMIHRTCALTGAEYEWGVHALAFGARLGLTAAQLHSTVHGSAGDPCWEPAEASVFQLATELHQNSSVGESLWHDLCAHFATEQIIELLVTAGWYHAIAYVCNGVQVSLEDWAARFPPA